MKNIIKVLFLSFIYSNSNVEYLIFTSNPFAQHAEIISELYTNEISQDLSLVTQILYIENIAAENFSEYLYNQNNNYVDTNDDFYNLKYLLIIGDESIIEPIYYHGSTPSDDYFSSKNQNTNIAPQPKLITGRIIINDANSMEQVNNIREYILNPAEGNWKSKLLLIADDQYKSGKTIREEKWHTIHSNVIYNALKDNLEISCLYGMDNERQQSLDWYTQPQLTDKIIDKINSGISMINYIGHGTSEVVADEHLLTLSDIDRISIENNKLPVWIVGTCSFGNYINENCLAEKILNKGNAAIAVISTTGGISYQANFNYLKDFFIYNLEEKIINNEDIRIGEIFFESKNSINASYTFHLFGDPAMPINIPRYNNNIITEDIEQITIGSFDNIPLNEQGKTFLKIYDEDNINNQIYNYCLGCNNYDINDSCNTYSTIYTCDAYSNCILSDCSEEDIISYLTPGNVLFNGFSLTSIIDYILPIDTDENNTANIITFNESTLSLESILNIDMNIALDEDLSNDNAGPSISIFQNNKNILDNLNVYPPYNISILFDDELPINLSGINYHNIRLWIDDNQLNSILLNDNFNYCEQNSNDPSICSYCNHGWCGYIYNLYLDNNYINQENHTINIESWDILNNHNSISLDINFTNENEIYNVYNFPNPFEDKTYFTFSYSGLSSINIKIEIFSLDGKLIKTIKENNLQNDGTHFYKIPNNGWDGKDNNGAILANGTYIYYLYVSDDNEKIHESLNKLTKLK